MSSGFFKKNRKAQLVIITDTPLKTGRFRRGARLSNTGHRVKWRNEQHVENGHGRIRRRQTPGLRGGLFRETHPSAGRSVRNNGLFAEVREPPVDGQPPVPGTERARENLQGGSP